MCAVEDGGVWSLLTTGGAISGNQKARPFGFGAVKLADPE